VSDAIVDGSIASTPAERTPRSIAAISPKMAPGLGQP
jgi:hypothetical protein